MLSQEAVDKLLALPKRPVSNDTIVFPMPGSALVIEVEAEDAGGRESFIIDANRKGKIKLSKCTYQERYQVIEILLRLDIDGPTHDNPDGEAVPCPHLHIYKEGFGTKWAYPLPDGFTDATNLVTTLREFLDYCGVRDAPAIQMRVL